MGRPRLDAEQKKVSFSLAFSPHLIAALDKVRGAKSQSVFVEEWLRQHPQIAAELAAMNDSGFTPPIARYERLMELLLAFYSPETGKRRTLAQILFIAYKVITHDHVGTSQDVEEQITTAMEDLWVQAHRNQRNQTARGESLEAVRPLINEYACYYYRVIFQEMARGEPKLLQHRFGPLVHGCEAVYRERMQQSGEPPNV
jgi:hypothetical protein